MSKKKIRYVGNRSTREFHRLATLRPECNFDLIKDKEEFGRGRQAINLKYDACPWCNSYWRSRRNATRHPDELGEMMEGETREK